MPPFSFSSIYHFYEVILNHLDLYKAECLNVLGLGCDGKGPAWVATSSIISVACQDYKR